MHCFKRESCCPTSTLFLNVFKARVAGGASIEAIGRSPWLPRGPLGRTLRSGDRVGGISMNYRRNAANRVSVERKNNVSRFRSSIWATDKDILGPITNRPKQGPFQRMAMVGKKQLDKRREERRGSRVAQFSGDKAEE